MYIKYHNWAMKLWIVIKFTVISFKYMFTSDNFTAKNCHIKLELSQNVMKTLTLQLHTKRNLVHQMMAKTFCWWYNTVLVKFRYQQFEILIQKIIQDNSFDQKSNFRKKKKQEHKNKGHLFCKYQWLSYGSCKLHKLSFRCTFVPTYLKISKPMKKTPIIL